MHGYSGVRRRSILKSVCGVGTAGALGGVVSANRSSRVGFVTGTFDNPVSVEERAEFRREIHANVKPLTVQNMTFHSEVGVDSSPVVAYAYGITSDGVPCEHLATVKRRDAVERKVREAKEFVAEFRSSADGISVADAESPWNMTAAASHPHDGEPFGQVDMFSKLYHLESGDYNSDIFAINHEVEVIPGVIIDDYCTWWSCPDQRAHGARSIQDWGRGDAESVGDVSPENEEFAGTVDCALSSEYGGPEIDWSFTLKNSTSLEPDHSQSDIQNGIAYWEFNPSNTGDKVNIFEPGSVAVFDQINNGEEILKLTFEGDFWGDGASQPTTVGDVHIIKGNKISE